MSQYKSHAQAVAIFDSVTPMISMWILLGFAGSHEDFDDRLHDIFAPAASLVTNTTILNLYAASAIFAVIALQMWSATRLFKATEIVEGEPIETFRLASTWIYATFVAIVIDTIGVVALGLFLFAIHLLLRVGIMIIIVFRFIQELQIIITSVPAPASVIVHK